MITESKINVVVRKIYPGKSMRAYVSIVIDDMLALHDVKVIYPIEGKMFIAMPESVDKNNVTRSIYHPMTQEFRNVLTSRVAEALAMVEVDEQAKSYNVVGIDYASGKDMSNT